MRHGFLTAEPRARARARAAAASSEGSPHGLPNAAHGPPAGQRSPHADWTEADSVWMRDFLLAVAHQPDAFQVEQVSPFMLLWSAWCGGPFLPPKPGQLVPRQQRWNDAAARAGTALFGWGLEASRRMDEIHFREVPLAPACTWCGNPSFNWCDACEEYAYQAVCNTCEEDMDMCRPCAGAQ